MTRWRAITASGALVLAGCRVESRRAIDSANDVRTVAVAAWRACGPPVVDSAGVGALRIGATGESVATRCTVLRDQTVRGAEGMPTRILTVPIGGDTVQAEVQDDRVWRIQVRRPALRTADSLGVGTPLATLLAIPGIRGAAGEGALFVMSAARCGISFELSHADPRADGWTAARLRQLPPTTVVTRVLIIGCRDDSASLARP